ncbi:MAG TPA: hypothetical protein VHV09_11165, partial [Trebonia sp.]|nr:hypothetical protein [Trebonia sp.]
MSSESQLAAADLSAPSAHSSPKNQPAEPGTASAGADFGANEWLVDELYQRYLADPGSVDKAWWSFFADYRPVRGNGNGTGPQPVLTATAAPPAPPESGPAPAGPAAPGPAGAPGAGAPAAGAAKAPVKPAAP